MRKLGAALISAAFVTALTTATASAATPPQTVAVSSCGVRLTAKVVGVVQSDFNCTATGSGDNQWYGIVLERGASLNLNGHTITLVQDQSTISVVRCLRDCTVYGGTITNANSSGGGAIDIHQHGKLTIHDVTINRLTVGIQAPLAKVIATNVSITAEAQGIYVAKQILLDHVDVTLTGVTIGECIGASQNGGKIDGHDVIVSGCSNGLIANGHVKVTNLTVTGSSFGVWSGGGLQLTDASVTGSTSVDISSRGKPKLVNTTCDTSRKVGTATTWGVCAND